MHDTSSPAPERTLALIDRYLAGRASMLERTELRQVLAQEPNGVERLNEIQALLTMSPDDEASTRERLRQLHRHMKAPRYGPLHRGFFSEQTLHLGRGSLSRKAVYATVGAAMAALVAVGFSAVSHRYSTVVHVPTVLSVHRYATAPGQHATVTFADGSQALLGPATTVSVTTQTSNTHLDVHVVGQALFTVAHGANKVFRVHTHNAVARVLGTTFLVRQYGTDATSHVVVIDGRVTLHGLHEVPSAAHDRVLRARDLGVVNDSGFVQVTPAIALDDYTSWTRGELVFHKTSVREIIAELGRTYDVDIHLADSALAGRTLTWTVPVAHRSLSNVLGTLNELLETHPVQSGRVITLVPGRLSVPKSIDPHPLSLLESQHGR